MSQLNVFPIALILVAASFIARTGAVKHRDPRAPDGGPDVTKVSKLSYLYGFRFK
jgi:hypothetical protein